MGISSFEMDEILYAGQLDGLQMYRDDAQYPIPQREL